MNKTAILDACGTGSLAMLIAGDISRLKEKLATSGLMEALRERCRNIDDAQMAAAVVAELKGLLDELEEPSVREESQREASSQVGIFEGSDPESW